MPKGGKCGCCEALAGSRLGTGSRNNRHPDSTRCIAWKHREIADADRIAVCCTMRNSSWLSAGHQRLASAALFMLESSHAPIMRLYCFVSEGVHVKIISGFVCPSLAAYSGTGSPQDIRAVVVRTADMSPGTDGNPHRYTVTTS
jgi:hypothetical protein